MLIWMSLFSLSSLEELVVYVLSDVHQRKRFDCHIVYSYICYSISLAYSSIEFKHVLYYFTDWQCEQCGSSDEADLFLHVEDLR